MHNCYLQIITELTNHRVGDHFPDHMKFPDFSSRQAKITQYRVFTDTNEKQGEAR